MGLLKDDKYLGKCFKDKRTKQLFKITRRFTAIDNVTVYKVQKLDTNKYRSWQLTEVQLLDLFEFDSVATLLHGSSIEELQREMQIEKAFTFAQMYGVTTGRWATEYFASWSKDNKNSGD